MSHVKMPNGTIFAATEQLLNKPGAIACDSQGRPLVREVPWEWEDTGQSVPDTFARVVALMREGMSKAEAGRQLGVSRSTVSRHAQRAVDGGLLVAEEQAS